MQPGGSFATPITAADLTKYHALAQNAPPRIRDAVFNLCAMVEQYHKRKGKRPSVEPGTLVPLTAEEVKRLDPVVPWDYECEAYQKLFDSLPDGLEFDPDVSKPNRRNRVVDENAARLRDACFKLLWYAKELTADRDPLTTDHL